jgi:hypothetical protein
VPEGYDMSVIVGHRLALRPAVGDEAAAATIQAEYWDRPVEAAVISTTGRSQLLLETDDRRVLELEERAVVAEASMSDALLRIQGMLELPGHHHGPSSVCMLSPFDSPQAVQRRAWVRVRTAVPVGITSGRGADGRPEHFRTVSFDLSGGGVKCRGEPGVGPGARVTLAIELPSGPVEVEGEVLGSGADGLTRLRFLRMPESVQARIVRHVFDVQLEGRRGHGHRAP